ncbi:zinc finger protein ZAT10 [Capsella rubella]|uniref:zinc finger protein ZAT10 n=1 Tax=Capsella rubella TaxID=81985 RepID=UPI000CD55296|nr:zinc finger protein ZAT10 [Capsella rubella]
MLEKVKKLQHVSLKKVLSYLEPQKQEDTKPVTSTKNKGFLLFNSHTKHFAERHGRTMNSSCIDFVMFSRGQHDEDSNMSRRPWKRPERSISTSSSHHNNHLNLSPNEDEELANCLVLLSNSGDHNKHRHGKGKNVKKQKTAQVFQCKACKKVFTSHQALGGHRASHKKVKGCFASQDKEEEDEEEYKEDDDEEEEDEDEEEEEEDVDKSTAHIARKRSNAHECTICHRVFSSGQALGGHKRCHWLTPSNYLRMTSSSSSSVLHDHHHSAVGRPQPLDQPSLDLNLSCQEYSGDPTAMTVGVIQRDGGGSNHNATSSSWLKLASGDWS